MSRLFIFIILILGPSCLRAQVDSAKLEQQRRDKLELILRFQDLRTIHDGKLVSFLSDSDPLVRERALRAFGSIQDTSAMPFLIEALSDRNDEVRTSAVFAIGQTAPLLSERKRTNLAHDLIWARMDRSGKAEQLVEEIGKFGTQQTLDDIVMRFGTGYPLPFPRSVAMGIARFAIRGIVTTSGVQYLLRFTKPFDVPPWEVLYALQRIGEHEATRRELENVVRLSGNDDPLVRMNLAILLGKIRDEGVTLEPLLRLAESDGDWRVRVNALKAVGNYEVPESERISDLFRRAFSDGNLHIAIISLQVYGDAKWTRSPSSDRHGPVEILKRIAMNRSGHYQWQVQAAAATALARVLQEEALPFITPTSWPQRFLQYDLLNALALTGSKESAGTLLEYLRGPDPFLQRAALSGLRVLSRKHPSDTALARQTRHESEQMLKSGDIALVTTAAEILGDSLFLSKSSVLPLMEALRRLQLPADIEAIQEVIGTLGKLRDRRAIDMLRLQLQKPDRTVALAAAAALQKITGRDHMSAVPRSVQPVFTDFDFNFLRSLPDTIPARIETAKGDIHVKLFKNAAPFTVVSFIKLAQRGFYRGLTFHRVVPNFVVQGGDPRGDGWGGPGYSIRSEFSDVGFGEGALGMASAGKDTEGSQFFITHSPQPHLDGRYTVFGRVVMGMDVVGRIQVDDRIYDVKTGR
jgi:cyclophilin family peptidyl-prolyl cis-trans isomerase/HEAT repeat protein